MAYTEKYCQNGGSNLNAGSTTNNTATYTSLHGDWNTTTRVFTPTDGSTPASTVSVGDFASVYIDGASVGVYVGRITVVNAGVNGTITVPAANAAGSSPANQTATATIKVGGAWLGPNAGSGFPFSLTTVGNLVNTSSNQMRINLKNDQTYSVTSSISYAVSGGVFVTQGYTSTVADGGKATVDGGTGTGAVITTFGQAGHIIIDMIFTTSITTGTSDLVTVASLVAMVRCIFKGARGRGVVTVVGTTFSECEFYDCNKSNSAGLCAVDVNGAQLFRVFVHDNAGSNTDGLNVRAGPSIIENCVIDTSGKSGIQLSSGSRNGLIQIKHSDFYNNAGDGINIASGALNNVWIENCNLIKNTGAGINNATTSANNVSGFVYNCGYGSGTQANGSADTLGNLSQSGTITYASNLTPWVDPANGDFRINLVTANFTGRQAFQETQGYSSPNTVGYPDIGAAQSLTGGGGTFSKETSYGSAY